MTSTTNGHSTNGTAPVAGEANKIKTNGKMDSNNETGEYIFVFVEF